MLICLIIAHLFIPAIPWSLKQKFPFWGIHIALFILPIGICIQNLLPLVSLNLRGYFRFLLVGLFVSSILWLIYNQMTPNIGNLAYASYKNIPVLIIQDLVAILGFLSLLLYSKELSKIPFISIIGKQTLAIYLMSQPFVVITMYVFNKSSILLDIQIFQFIAGMLSIILGVIGPLIITRFLLSRKRIISILFPRSLSDFLTGFKLITHPQV